MTRVFAGIVLMVCLAGCDGDEQPAAAAPVSAEAKEATTPASPAPEQRMADPMARLANKSLYSHMDPMVALRSWDKVLVGAASGAGAGGGAGPVALADMPAGEGREVTYGLCGACHSMQLVVQQRLPEHRWDELWTWMIQTQGMPDPGPEIRTQILAYLKQNFSS